MFIDYDDEEDMQGHWRKNGKFKKYWKQKIGKYDNSDLSVVFAQYLSALMSEVIYHDIISTPYFTNHFSLLIKCYLPHSILQKVMNSCSFFNWSHLVCQYVKFLEQCQDRDFASAVSQSIVKAGIPSLVR